MKRTARLARKAALTLVGAVLLVAGVAMLVLPGPGTLVTVLGLLVLAMEYDWAREHSQRAKAYAQRITHETIARKWSFALSILSSTAMVVAGVLLAGMWGLLLAGASLVVSGVLALGTLLFSYLHAKR